MTNLVLVGDAAYPPNPATYPADMVAVCGYLGGDTPHVWTNAEIAALRATGRAFWPIWTAPNSKAGTAIFGAIGARDAAGMIAQLVARNIPKDVPVFYDVEYSTWAASPTGATFAISTFKRDVSAAGWKEVYAYCTTGFNRDWVAKWTNVRPTSLPVDWVGQQYGGRPDLDYSVFDLDKLGVTVPLSQDDVAAVAQATAAQVGKDMRTYIPAYMTAEFGGSVNRLVTALGLEQQEQVTLQRIEDAIKAAGTPGSTIDTQAVAQAVHDMFGAAFK